MEAVSAVYNMKAPRRRRTAMHQRVAFVAEQRLMSGTPHRHASWLPHPPSLPPRLLLVAWPANVAWPVYLALGRDRRLWHS